MDINIILPFSHIVLKTLDLLGANQINPAYILPDHGIFWHKYLKNIIKHYHSWASSACAKGVLILYDSMWGSTEIMANRLYEALLPAGIKAPEMSLLRWLAYAVN